VVENVEERANQSILFPDPATNLKDNQELASKGKEKRTFSVYPQEGHGGFPLTKYTSSKKPLSCTIMMSFACVVMIGGWILGR
jgi:hypothetical protein